MHQAWGVAYSIIMSVIMFHNFSLQKCQQKTHTNNSLTEICIRYYMLGKCLHKDSNGKKQWWHAQRALTSGVLMVLRYVINI